MIRSIISKDFCPFTFSLILIQWWQDTIVVACAIGEITRRMCKDGRKRIKEEQGVFSSKLSCLFLNFFKLLICIDNFRKFFT